MKLLIFCRKAKALASRALHGWYEKRLTVEDLLAEADGGRFTWIGAGGAAVECCAAGPGFPGMQRAQDELPALLVEDENWRFQPLAPDACLVIGRFRLTTIPESGLVLSEQQRATFLLRADGEAVRLCHIHISSPAGRKRRSLYAFDEPAARREYMGELAARRLAGRFPELTKRQVKVLCFLMQGLPYKDIADAMNITPRTVRYYVTEIERRLHAENRTLLIETVLQRNTGGVISAYGDVRRKTPARVFFSCPPVSRRAQGRGPLWLGGLIKKIYTGTSGTAVGREVKGNGGNSYNFYRFVVVSWKTTKEGGICMKMKKAYAAAFAAAMVLTAGFSAQASVQVFSGDYWVESNNTHASIVDGVLQAQVGSTGLEVTGEGTRVTGDAVFENNVTVNGTTNVNGHFNAQTEDFTVQSGKNNVFVTENGIQLNNGGNSLYVNETGTKVEGGLTADEVKGENANFGYVHGDQAQFTEANVENLNADKVDANTGSFGEVKGENANFGTGSFDEVKGENANFGYVHGDQAQFTEANVENLNADKVDANTGSFGELTVGGTNVSEKFNQIDQTNWEQNAAIDKANSTALGAQAMAQENAAAIAQNTEKITANSAAIEHNSQRIDALSGRVDDLGGEIDNVGAISAALAGLHPLDYDGTGSKFQLAAAMGSYDGSQAAAIGGFYHFNEDVMMSVGGATAFDGDNKSAFNVGVSFRIGQGSSGKKVNSDDVLAQLNAMNEKIAALEAENQQLSEKVAALEGGEGAEAAEAE